MKSFEPDELVQVSNGGSVLVGTFIMSMGEDCVVLIGGSRRWFKLSKLTKAHAQE